MCRRDGLHFLVCGFVILALMNGVLGEGPLMDMAVPTRIAAALRGLALPLPGWRLFRSKARNATHHGTRRP